MAPYIRINTGLREMADNDFEDDLCNHMNESNFR